MFVPCVNDSSETAAKALMNQWVCLFGAPYTINTDRGTHFTAEAFQALCRIAGIDHKLGAAKHPESQGKVYRQNQHIGQEHCMCENNVEKWPEALYWVTLIHNASQSETIKLAPLRILLSREPRTLEVAWIRDQPCSREFATSRGEDRHYMEALLQDKERELARMIKEAKEQTRNAQLRRLEGQMTRGTGYKVGDLVKIKLDSNEIKRQGKKLAIKSDISTTSKTQPFVGRIWKVVMKRYLLKQCGCFHPQGTRARNKNWVGNGEWWESENW